MPDLLSVKNLKIEATSYPPGEPPKVVTLVEGVSFDLEKGKVLGLIGESGAGKSTIGLSALAYGRGGCRIIGGEVLLNGKNILTLGRSGINAVRGAQVCYVAQSAAAAFNPAHKLGDQVIEASLRHGIMSREEASERALYLFRVLGLPNPENFGDRYPHQVSGGQLQRAMTAMALCSKPDLIVFDEPTTALDVTTQIDVLAAIKHAIEETDTAALYITHDLAVVAQISDDIMVLRHGKTVEYGTTKQVIEAPREEYTRALVASVRPNATKLRTRPARCSRSNMCMPATRTASRYCTTSRCTCRRARRWQSSANPAQANRRSRASSPGCCRQAKGASPSKERNCRKR